ncbi:3-deoxy-D-manno-octulosonic acid transferase [Limimaricola litoreus]|uniref:3-deoxy-D-manno-octulosonic acid transferase n=1 Tax=Limimaricola litoreus TaxID=2955316 RepID=A0A9X2JRA6_9RHOB|nr:glycosyltransferase N-terminal domain-containing protein [Limimaricola litoreus]MCP1168511.1 3-deoxy-D-manno-octulosonic acid transferase [Limimaricola litoreus]
MSPAPWPLRLWLGGSRALPRLAEITLARRVHRGQTSAPARLRERLGRATLDRPEGPLVWINAASVGEVASVADLARDLMAEGAAVLVTTTTTTGGSRVRRIEGALHQYQPLDTARATRAFLDHWQPDLACFVEGDLWPRLLAETAARKVPLALLNARPSKSRARAPRLSAALLSCFDLVTAQSEAVREDILSLGLDPARVLAPGDLKSAASPLPADPARLPLLEADFAGAPLWAAVSTHAEDEPEVIAAHLAARAAHPGLRLILAPRHPDRAPMVERALREAGLGVTRGERPGDAEVWLVDRMGETGAIFRLAPLVFLGGAFGPQGGHNPWEAAALGAALLHGPRVDNAAGAYAALDGAGAAREVADGAALGQAVATLIGTPELGTMRAAARKVMADRGQARPATLAALRGLMATRLAPGHTSSKAAP